MSAEQEAPRIVTVSRDVDAPAATVFELIAEPSNQPRWDGNDNLFSSEPGQRVGAVGETFTMTLTRDNAVRVNHVVEFEEGRLIAWCPASVGQDPAGHRWRWEVEPLGEDRSRVVHTYDWTELGDERRLARARATTEEQLRSSLDRLAALAESR